MASSETKKKIRLKKQNGTNKLDANALSRSKTNCLIAVAYPTGYPSDFLFLGAFYISLSGDGQWCP